MTGTGLYLGTPDYSAPEQIRGRAVDGRADQYALGCVAYELLTERVPFERDDDLALMFAHVSEPPPSLVARLPGLPGAVDQVLAKALAKDPDDRYGSCEDFASALREALGLAPSISLSLASALDHPQTEIASPPSELPGPDEAGREDVPADVAIAVTIDPEPGGASPVTADQPAAAVAVTETAERDPLTVGADVPASVAHAAHRPGTITEWIGRHRRITIALASTVLAVAIVVPTVLASSSSSTNSPKFSSVATLGDPSPSANVASVAFSPAGTTLAVGDTYNSTYLWKIATHKLTATLTDPNSKGVSSVAFSPDAMTLAVDDGNGSTYLWNIPTGTMTATLTNPGSGFVDSVAFSPDGLTLVGGDNKGNTYLWNVATQTLTATLTNPNSQGVSSVAFSPDGATLAAGDENGSICLWNTTTHKLTATLTTPGSASVSSVAFSPDGTTLAVGDDDGSIYLWNVATKKLAATLTDSNSHGISSVAFSRDGSTLAAGGGDGKTDLWNVATQKLTATLTDPDSGGVNAVAFSPDGMTLAVGDINGSTYLWRKN